MDRQDFLDDLGQLDRLFDVPARGQPPAQNARREGEPVMWPEDVPSHIAPPVRDDVAPGAAAAVILACIAAGGAAALIFRDAIVALLAR